MTRVLLLSCGIAVAAVGCANKSRQRSPLAGQGLAKAPGASGLGHQLDADPQPTTADLPDVRALDRSQLVQEVLADGSGKPPGRPFR